MFHIGVDVVLVVCVSRCLRRRRRMSVVKNHFSKAEIIRLFFRFVLFEPYERTESAATAAQTAR